MTDTPRTESEFLGAIQGRLIELGYDPPAWPEHYDDVESAAQMIGALLTRIAELERQQSILIQAADRYGDGEDWIQRSLQAEAKLTELERHAAIDAARKEAK